MVQEKNTFNFIVLPKEFRYSSKPYHCDNILKIFHYPTPMILNETMAQTQCERFCGRENGCWGCIQQCNKTCKWTAQTSCDDNSGFNATISKQISQKPGNKDNYQLI